jgi:hypothetical protein
MLRTKIGAGAGDTDPANQLTPAAVSYSKNRSEKQQRTIPPLPDAATGISVADWARSLVDAGLFQAVEAVEGDLGPIAVIGSPRVIVGFGNNWTAVWIERLPWGWSDPYKLFLSPMSKAAIRYAVTLGERVKKAAEREKERLDRKRGAVVRGVAQ